MNLSKKSLAFIAGIAFSVLTAMVVMFGLTSSVAFGAEGTADAPEFYCEYFDEQGNAVDGNSLTAGTYNVDFYVKGFDTISVLEFTATYDTSIVTVGQVSNLISSMSSMGTVTTDGNLVFGFASKTGPVSVNADGERLATFSLTFSADCDAADYITASDNPNLTFVVVDSTGDNYDDEYALTESFEGYTGSLTLMSCDITPAFTAAGYDITGRIMIAADATGTASEFGIVGITVDVLDSEGSAIATAVTDANGNYTLTGVPAGTYSVSVHGDTTVDRQVTLNVDSDKTVDNFGIVICDYNKDTYLTGLDLSDFLGHYGGDYYVYADLNADGNVTGLDLSDFLNVYGKDVNYTDVTL